jgi:hypothetical protein
VRHALVRVNPGSRRSVYVGSHARYKRGLDRRAHLIARLIEIATRRTVSTVIAGVGDLVM